MKIKELALSYWKSIKEAIHTNRDYVSLFVGLFVSKTVEGKLWEGVLFGAIGAFVLFILKKMIKVDISKDINEPENN